MEIADEEAFRKALTDNLCAKLATVSPNTVCYAGNKNLVCWVTPDGRVYMHISLAEGLKVVFWRYPVTLTYNDIFTIDYGKAPPAAFMKNEVVLGGQTYFAVMNTILETISLFLTEEEADAQMRNPTLVAHQDSPVQFLEALAAFIPPPVLQAIKT